MSSAGSPVTIQAGGTVDRTNALYIERAEDDDLLALLAQGRYANVLTSRQMGKSSLILSTAMKLVTRDVDCVIADVGAQFGGNHDQLDAYAGLLDYIRDQLAIDLNVKEWMTNGPRGTPNQHFLRFFREIGSTLDRPVVIFLDEIESTLRVPYADDLFVAIRTIYNERALHAGYRRFTFCLVGVASPNDLVRNQRITPYNIGVTLELRDFERGRDDLAPLAAQLHPNPDVAQRMLDAILYWTDGHPYLTMKFADDLARDQETNVDGYVERTYLTLRSIRSDTHFDAIDRFMALRLSEALATFALYERILGGAEEPDLQARPQRQLKLSGLVKRNLDGHLIVRNRIYAALFDRQWVGSSRPRRTVRRLRVAVAVMMVVLLALTGSTWLNARATARRHLALIANSKELPEATRSFETLTGGREAPVPALFLLQYRNDAKRAFGQFKNKHGNDLLLRAATARERGSVDDALLFGARAAEVLGQPLDRETVTLLKTARIDRLLHTLRGPPVLSGGIGVSADGRYVAIGSSVWSSANGRLLFELADRFVNAVAFDAAGRLYSGDDDGVVKRWTLPGLQASVLAEPVRQRPVQSIAVSPDGSVLGIVDKGTSARMLRTGDGTPIASLAHGREPILSIQFSDAGVAVTAGEDGTVRLWSRDGAPIATLRHADAVTAAAISRDGKMVATAAGTLLTLWDGRGRMIHDVRESAEIFHVAISRDGSEVGAVTSRGFQRYAVPDLAVLGSIPGEGFLEMAYGPDGKWAVTLSVTAARIWDLSPETIGGAPPGLSDLQQRLHLELTDDDQNVIPIR